MAFNFTKTSFACFLAGLSSISLAYGQTTIRASVDSNGVEALGWNDGVSISEDGRFIAFESSDHNLVAGDTNSARDIFVHDSQTGVTERINVDSFGNEANDDSFKPSLSADGRFVVFQSLATNLVPGAIWVGHVYIHDRQLGTTGLISMDSSGNQALGRSDSATISANGRFVAYSSFAQNIILSDTNQRQDVFVFDRLTSIPERVSVSSGGQEGNENCFDPAISADGNSVTFSSGSTNLVVLDTNMAFDVFVHNRLSGATERVSLDSGGNQGNAGVSWASPKISGDGRLIVFCSSASNLVVGDTNGNDDVFVHDRQTGDTKRVSVSSTGVESTTYTRFPTISSDGSHVAFRTAESNFAPNDTNFYPDIFIHDLRTGATQRVSLSSLGTQGDGICYASSLSKDGQRVAFVSTSTNLVAGASAGQQGIYVHDRWDGMGSNSIFLTAPATWPVGIPMTLSWEGARPDSRFLVAYSVNINGSTWGGHPFDIGIPQVLLGTGLNTGIGTGSITTLPIPPSAAGRTLYFEVGTRDAFSALYDSNVQAIVFY